MTEAGAHGALRFAANLSMLFCEVPFLERFERAARAGFQAVEFQFPYAHAAHEIRARLDSNGLQAVLHNLPAGDWALGERGIACHPARVGEFRSGVARAIKYAHALGVPRLNCLAGCVPEGVSRAKAHAALVENLAFAAAALAHEGLLLLIEPLNTFDTPGFFLERNAQAAAILAEVGAANLSIQFDVYHAQRTEGDFAAALGEHWPRIGHIQIADHPGRHEPGTGAIDFPALFAQLRRLGHAGWIGCEYRPLADTEAGLHWMQGGAER